MKWVPAKLGAEPRKMAILGVLGLVLLYVAWSNLFSGGGSSSPAAAPQAHALTPYANVGPEAPAPPAAAQARRPGANAKAARPTNLEDFKPSMKRARLIASDPTQVDPTLRLDLLARLQGAKFEGSMRSLFEFSQAPPAPLREPAKIIPGATRSMIGPQPLDPPKPPPPPPPPPPIPLKFYGFVNPARPDIKRAFFLDGEDILVAGEGETVHNNRYRIVRIGVNSAVVEDTQYKNQQTLPLVAEEQG
jgi:hypothetical protein